MENIESYAAINNVTLTKLSTQEVGHDDDDDDADDAQVDHGHGTN